MARQHQFSATGLATLKDLSYRDCIRTQIRVANMVTHARAELLFIIITRNYLKCWTQPDEHFHRKHWQIF